ncbi:integral membrane protein [Colletotrichum tabaci]|uniref:Integral membrane protein n=1 Tax=Colletotrichum tabaci TaxID=1209068 RepID=A0AAV9TN29_9PEZI
MAGETGTISVSQVQAMVMIAFAATAYYNTIEIFFSIFTTFKRRRGRYFWSMIVANAGINVNVIAFVLRYFGYYHEAVFASSIIIPLAWYSMVTGQAIVLWSRLHLVVHSQRQIRLVLAMIVFNAVTMHIPETVIFFLANNVGKQWAGPFKIYEKVELVVFTVQESVIAAFFLYQGYKSLKPLSAIRPKAVTNMVRHLAALFTVVFVLDTGLIILEYSDKFEIQTMCKPFVYSVKLKVEFVVLNKLLAFTRMSTCNCRGPESIPSATLALAGGSGNSNSNNRTTAPGPRGNKNGNPAELALPDVEQTGGSLSPIWQSIQSDRIFDGRTSPTSTRSRRRAKENGGFEITTTEATSPLSPPPPMKTIKDDG